MNSNNLTQVRDYLRTRLAVVEPNFKEWTGSLEDIGNIPKTLLDRSYHIDLGTIGSTPQTDKSIIDSQTVLLSIFKRGFNDPTEARDALLQTANCIRLDVITPQNVEAYKAANNGNIEVVESVSITPSALGETNDNIIKVEIELSVRLYLGIA